jgi:hypothetical protein
MKSKAILALFLTIGSAFGVKPSSDDQRLFCEATLAYVAYGPSDVINNFECSDVMTDGVGEMRKVEGKIKGSMNDKNFSSTCNFYYVGEPLIANIVGGVELINCEDN